MMKRTHATRVSSPLSLRRVAALHAKTVLDAHGGNKQATCEALGVAYHTLNGLLRDAARVTPTPAIETQPEQVIRIAARWGIPTAVMRAELQTAEWRVRHQLTERTDPDGESEAREQVDSHSV